MKLTQENHYWREGEQTHHHEKLHTSEDPPSWQFPQILEELVEISSFLLLNIALVFLNALDWVKMYFNQLGPLIEQTKRAGLVG